MQGYNFAPCTQHLATPMQLPTLKAGTLTGVAAKIYHTALLLHIWLMLHGCLYMYYEFAKPQQCSDDQYLLKPLKHISVSRGSPDTVFKRLLAGLTCKLGHFLRLLRRASLQCKQR